MEPISRSGEGFEPIIASKRITNRIKVYTSSKWIVAKNMCGWQPIDS